MSGFKYFPAIKISILIAAIFFLLVSLLIELLYMQKEVIFLKDDRYILKFTSWILTVIAIAVFFISPWAKLPENYINNLSSQVASSEDDVVKSIEDVILSEDKVATLNVDNILVDKSSEAAERRIQPDTIGKKENLITKLKKNNVNYVAFVLRGQTESSKGSKKVVILTTKIDKTNSNKEKRLKWENVDTESPTLDSILKSYAEKYPENKGYPSLSLETVNSYRIISVDNSLRVKQNIISIIYVLAVSALIVLYSVFIAKMDEDGLLGLAMIFIILLVLSIMLSICS